MKVSCQHDPRANQKARTRAAIVEGAKLMLREGATPTVAQAAKRARVSRATAYRYFPTQQALLVEVAEVTPRMATVEEALRRLDTEDVAERLEVLLDTFGSVVLAEEEHLRRALLVYQDTWLRNHPSGARNGPAVREGRRMRWLDTVLEPLTDLPEWRRQRLRAALALTLGIDALVVMKDVSRLDADEARATLHWAATALLRTALDEESAAVP